MAGPLTASLGVAREPGSADTGATAPGACETIGAIVLGSGLGETVDDSIDGCSGSAADDDELSKVFVGADIGVVINVDVVGL